MSSPAARRRPARFRLRAVLRVTTLQQLKTLSDPLRVDMLELIRYEARTVKQVATQLGLPPTKLYYHMKALEAAGFARVVQTQVKSGIIEKYYRSAARIFVVDPDLFATHAEPNSRQANLFASMLQATADDVRRSVDAGLIQLPPTTHEPARDFVIKRGLFKLHAQDVPRFVAGFNALIDELDAHSSAKGDVDYGFAVAFYQRPARAKPKRRG